MRRLRGALPICLLPVALSCGRSPTDTPPADPDLLIRDTFSRVEREGWGVADVGGRWHMNVPGPVFHVDGNSGIIELRNADPQNVVGRGSGGYGVDVVGVVSFSVDRAPDDEGQWHAVQVYARRNDRVGDGDYYYRYRVRIFGSGMMDVRIEKNIGAVWTWLTDVVPLDLTFAPGTKYWIGWEAFGVSPTTTVRMRVWQEGTPEPPLWQTSAVVNEPILDVSGTTGIRFQGPSAGQLNFPLRLLVDDLEYRNREPEALAAWRDARSHATHQRRGRLPVSLRPL